MGSSLATLAPSRRRSLTTSAANKDDDGVETAATPNVKRNLLIALFAAASLAAILWASNFSLVEVGACTIPSPVGPGTEEAAHPRSQAVEALAAADSEVLGPVAFVVVYAAATVLLFPASVLTLAAGALFGPLKVRIGC